MESLIHADIFFFITSIGVVIMIVAVIVIASYVIRILGDIRAITKRFRASADHVGDAIDTAADDVEKNGLIATLISIFHRKKKKHHDK